jgi:orotate phosphoribosyltransferase
MDRVDKSELVTGLYDTGLLRIGGELVRLASKRLSPVYCDLRTVNSFRPSLIVNGREVPLARQRWVQDIVIATLSDTVDALPDSHDHLFGIEEGATVLGGLVARERRESYVWRRARVKAHGVPAEFVGKIEAGDSLKVIDDVITDGKSKILAVEDTRSAGFRPQGVAILFDRDEGGAVTMEAAHVPFAAAVSLSEAAAILLAESRIGNAELDLLAQYHSGLTADGVLSTYQPPQ